MLIEKLRISTVEVLVPNMYGDHRGFLSEVYSRRTLAEAGVQIDFVEDNHSLSAEKGTVRGLHFLTPPFAQDKLVSVVRGTVFDVAVDFAAELAHLRTACKGRPLWRSMESTSDTGGLRPRIHDTRA